MLILSSSVLYADETLVKAYKSDQEGVVEIKFLKEVSYTELLIGDRLILSFSEKIDFKPSRIMEELDQFLDDLTLQKQGKVLVFDLKETPKVHPEVKQERNIIKVILSTDKPIQTTTAVQDKKKDAPIRDKFDVKLLSKARYDRIEINWDSSMVKYSTDFKNQIFKVIFNQSAKLDPYQVEQLKSKLVSEVKVLSLSPLSLAFKILKNSEVVPRKYDNKLFIDVVDESINLLENEPDKAVSTRVLQPSNNFEVFHQEELLLTPGVNAGMVVFQRGPFLYIGFDRKLEKGFDLFHGREGLVEQFKELSNPEITIFSAKLQDNFDIKILRDTNQWKLLFLIDDKEQDVNAKAIHVKHDPGFPMGARVLIENNDANKMFWFIDPHVKDKVKLIPLSDPGERIDKDQSFVQFELLKTAQGIVIKEFDDDIITRFISDGIEISHPKELYISSQTDLDAVQKNKVVDTDGELLFDFVSWRQGGINQFKKVEENFFQTLAYTDAAEKNSVRFDFAKFYLSHGLAQEAIGILRFLKHELPGIEERPEYRVVYGLASYLARHKKEAIEQFNNPMFDQNAEVKFWRALLDEDINKNRDALYKYAHFIESYPYPLQHHVALDLAEKLTRLEEFDRLKLVLNGLKGDKKTTKAAAAGIAYYNGVIAKKAGDEIAARKYFEALRGFKDRYYRALSKLFLINMDLKDGKITTEKAIDELENLQFVWRGDYFERDVLIALTNTYLREKNYRSALEYMKKIVTLFPEHPGTQLITANMSDLFEQIFLTDKLNELTAIEAYSLYKNFMELNPVDEKGNQIIENVAEKLVDIEVLDKAQEMYDYQLEYRLEGNEKAKAGARLAAIYLLDDKPKLALEALDKSIPDRIENSLSEQRQVLRASALFEMDDLIGAKDLLKHMNTSASNMLLIDIAWKEKKWMQASKLLEKIIVQGEANDTNSLIDDYVIKLATALSLGDDTLALQRFRDVFASYMENSPNHQVFEVLTLPEKYQDTLDMQYVQDQIKDVDIFDQFLENYKKI